MKKTIYSQLLLLVVLFSLSQLLYSCATAMLEVHTVHDRTVSLQPYRTFAFYPRQEREMTLNGETPAYNTSVDEQLKMAVASELVKHGLTPATEEDTPDMLIAYDIAIETNQATASDAAQGFGYGYGYWYGYRYNYATTDTAPLRNIQEYQLGTLLIDLVDPRTNTLLWRGWAEGGVTVTEANSNRLNRTIASIMAQYPVK